MGCGGSKEGANNKAIDSGFETINIARFDDFFSSASGLLESAEKIRSGIDDSKDTGHELAGTWMLAEPTYKEAIRVLFWAISAENKGKITDADIDLTAEAPFFKVNKKKLTAETYDLCESFLTYLKTVFDGPAALKDIVEKLQEMANQAPGLVTEAKTEIEGASHLDFMGKAKAISKMMKNSAKLPKELKKCLGLVEVLKGAKTDFTELIPKLKEMLSKADETGCKAVAQKLKNPSDIFEKFHTEPRKPAKQIADEKKAQEAAKAKKDGKDKPTPTPGEKAPAEKGNKVAPSIGV